MQNIPLSLESFEFEGADLVSSPQLIYYKDQIKKNTETIVEMARNAVNLWPHIKTHKSTDVTRLLMDQGITRFKASTIAEAEMLAQLEATHICLSNLLVGPSMARYVSLVEQYPQSEFWTLADDVTVLEQLNDLFRRSGRVANILIDVNFGLDRTGIRTEQIPKFVKDTLHLEHVRIRGFHCYDGNVHQPEFDERMDTVKHNNMRLQEVLDELVDSGREFDTLILGGSPSFPCHALLRDRYFSPGTSFINDYVYYRNYPDIACPPAAAVLTRVISRPGPGLFTLDAGTKAVSPDKLMEDRGYIVGLGNSVRPLRQNEEHWVWEVVDSNTPIPEIGDAFYVVPGHICPTTALYDHVEVIEDGRHVGQWDVTARNRKITI